MARVETLAPDLRRIVAPNPSPMTERGTNTYLIGRVGGPVTVIDPGPDLPDHLGTILYAAGRGGVARILVTHAHRDHSALAPALGARTGAPVLAYGDAAAGRSEVMAGLAEIGGGEGLDADFSPDAALADAATLETEAGPITALWTPGHFGNHLSFLWRGAAFSGDLVMGWSTSIVSPPDGDVAQFRASCRRLAAARPAVLHPGHGAAVADPAGRIGWLLAHRERREAEILETLARGPATAEALAGAIYADLGAHLLPAAARNVLAHLVDLEARGRVAAIGELRAGAAFALA